MCVGDVKPKMLKNDVFLTTWFHFTQYLIDSLLWKMMKSPLSICSTSIPQCFMKTCNVYILSFHYSHNAVFWRKAPKLKLEKKHMGKWVVRREEMCIVYIKKSSGFTYTQKIIGWWNLWVILIFYYFLSFQIF